MVLKINKLFKQLSSNLIVPKEDIFYNNIELLVHPFFQLEHAKRFGRTGYLKNVSEKKILTSYQMVEIIDYWKERIRKTKEDPHRIMIIIGPKQMSWERNNEFFTGSLTKEKLGQMNQIYQDFLHDAKKELGSKLVYLTQGISPEKGQHNHLAKVLHKRQLFPSPHVMINAYGEFYDQCVVDNLSKLKKYVTVLQEHYIRPKVVKSVQGRRLLRPGNGKLGFISFQNHTTYLLETLKELKKRGKLSVKFLKKIKRRQSGVDFNSERDILTKEYHNERLKRKNK